MNSKASWLLAAIAFSLSSIFLKSNAMAQQRLNQMPDFRLVHPSRTLHEFILGPTCLSMKASPLELSCNPAHLADEEKRQFRLNFVGNDRIGMVNDYRLRIEDDDTMGLVSQLHDQTEPLMAQASAGFWYQHEWWALGYTPFRAGFVSHVRNFSYTEIAAHLYKESEWFGKVGFGVADHPELQVGAQLRFVQREFFRNEFALLDALADASILKIEEQDVIFLEPGVSYSFDEHSMDLLSFSIMQLPVYQHGSRQPVRPVLDVGYSTAPRFADGKLRTSTHFTHSPEITDFFKRFRAGFIYDFDDVAAASLSIAKSEFGIGLNGNYKSLILGAGYKLEVLTPDAWSSKNVSSYYFELGFIF